MIYVGVDVGVNGGIAALDSMGDVVQAIKMPPTDELLLAALDYSQPARAVLERVASSPQMGVKSAFTFGGGYRACRLALTARLVPYVEVSPQKWQRAMDCMTGGDKQVTKQAAQHLFPETRVTHYVSDALLLAEYCRRHHGQLFKGD